MRKIVLFLAVAMGLLMVQQSHASTYRLDEAAVDQLFDSAIETSMIDSGVTSAGMSSTDYTVEGKDPMVAILLDFFLHWGSTVSTWVPNPFQVLLTF